jgi:oligopeptide transport system substrate-binding protein
MFQKTLRILSIVMAIFMLVSCVSILAACQKPENPDNETTTGAENGGEQELVRDPNAEYTYNTFLSTFPTVWNNHTYQTATDGEIIGYTEPGFYTFDYNETLDGYKVVPDMATSEPIDVTADYVGDAWGIAEGDTARAWKIVLRQDIKWEDGTPIKAADFVESAKRLLNPVANNYRADNLYNGNMVIHNAKNYFYGGKNVDEDNGAVGAFTRSDLVKGADGVYTTAAGEKVWIATSTAIDWLGGRTLDFYTDYYKDAMFDMTAYASLKALADENGNVAVTDESLALLTSVITFSPSWGETEEEVVQYMMFARAYPELSFDTVGVKAVSDYELVLIMDKPLEGFYLLYSLTGAWLVKTDLYDSCITNTDGVYNITYGTSVDTYMSYGPYKLTSFQADKQFVLEKNDKWYGYNDEANANNYWTTKIVYDYIQNPETAMEAFLQGKLDAKGLDIDQMEEYSKSDYCYYTTGDSTFFIAMNPDMDALKAEQEKVGANVNKTILTIKEFRQALSFSLDRAAFCLATSPSNAPAFGAYSSLIISDPETGTAYRTTQQAKEVLVNFWGVADEIGEGKLYADIDEAIESITGYNLDMGKEYFNIAYDKAVEAGLMDADDKIEICIGIPSAESKFYNNGYDFLVNNYTEAVKGTKLEGKLTFTRDDTIGNGFSDALKANQVNLLFGVGWTGSALDPYGLMEAYTSSDYQYDPAWDTTSEVLEIAIDGVKYTATVWDWTLAIMGETITIKAADGTTKDYSCGLADEKPEERLTILAALEGAVLQTYDMLPIMDDASAALKGMQIKYYTEEYIYGVGRGGVKYMQYYYTDAQWAEYVASQGGTLNYK